MAAGLLYTILLLKISNVHNNSKSHNNNNIRHEFLQWLSAFNVQNNKVNYAKQLITIVLFASFLFLYHTKISITTLNGLDKGKLVLVHAQQQGHLIGCLGFIIQQL